MNKQATALKPAHRILLEGVFRELGGTSGEADQPRASFSCVSSLLCCVERCSLSTALVLQPTYARCVGGGANVSLRHGVRKEAGALILTTRMRYKRALTSLIT